MSDLHARGAGKSLRPSNARARTKLSFNAIPQKAAHFADEHKAIHARSRQADSQLLPAPVVRARRTHARKDQHEPTP